VIAAGELAALRSLDNVIETRHSKGFTPSMNRTTLALGKWPNMVGRKEERSYQQLEVLLSCGRRPVFAELASTENATSYGMRVRTERPWRPGTPIFIKSSQGEWMQARVVYCQVLHAKSFALGLEFETRAHECVLR
jgi:hypothetical protein